MLSTLDEASQAAASVENRDERVLLLARIAVLRHRTGDRAAGAEALSAALAAAAACARTLADSQDRDRTLGAIASRAAAAGAIPQALDAARAIAASDERAHCLVSITRMQGESGGGPAATASLVEAREAARSIAEAVSAARLAGDEDGRVLALSHIAPNQPRMGRLLDPGPLIAETLCAVARMDGDACRAGALCELAEAKAGAGDAGTARAAARRLARDGGNDGRLSDICDALCWGNAAGDAVATARDIASARARAGTLVWIARYQAGNGDPDGAGRTRSPSPWSPPGLSRSALNAPRRGAGADCGGGGRDRRRPGPRVTRRGRGRKRGAATSPGFGRRVASGGSARLPAAGPGPGVRVGHDGGDERADFLDLGLAAGRDEVAGEGLRGEQRGARDAQLGHAPRAFPPVERFHRERHDELVGAERGALGGALDPLPLCGTHPQVLLHRPFDGVRHRSLAPFLSIRVAAAVSSGR